MNYKTKTNLIKKIKSLLFLQDINKLKKACIIEDGLKIKIKIVKYLILNLQLKAKK